MSETTRKISVVSAFIQDSIDANRVAASVRRFDPQATIEMWSAAGGGWNLTARSTLGSHGLTRAFGQRELGNLRPRNPELLST